jgi:hypothetical protein
LTAGLTDKPRGNIAAAFADAFVSAGRTAPAPGGAPFKLRQSTALFKVVR